jgi:DNA-binding Lrp family transcriptional regulator
MSTAFVLIGVETGTERVVAEQLRKIDGAKIVFTVFGVYDIVLKVEAPTERQLKETITYRVRKLENVRSTQTLLALD